MRGSPIFVYLCNLPQQFHESYLTKMTLVVFSGIGLIAAVMGLFQIQVGCIHITMHDNSVTASHIFTAH